MLHLLKSVSVCVFIAVAAPVLANHPAVVRLTVPVKDGANSLGSGVLAGADEKFGYVLTAHHVVRDADGHPKVRFTDGTVERGQVLKTDAAADLALIRVNRPPVPPVEWASASPEEGDELVAAGFGSDGNYQEAAGPVIGFTTRAEKTPAWMIVKAQVRSGDSGGPVFTKEGKLAGVLWGCNENTYASPVGRLYRFSQSNRGRLFPIGRRLFRMRRAAATAAAPSRGTRTPEGA